MSDDARQPEPDAVEGGLQDRLIGTEEGKAKARKLFAHAKKAEDTRNYDYAIELYVSGLAHWPDAIDEGLKKLRVVATARRLAGGKPPGFMLKRKYPTAGKDAAQNLNHALHLFGLNPTDLGYLEQILQLAAKTHCDAVAEWIAPVLADALNSAKQLSEDRYSTACRAMDACADQATAYGNEAGAMEILRANITTAQIWLGHHAHSTDAPRAASNASGKLTIIKGKFDKADGFQESLKNAEQQHDIQDRDKKVHTVDRTLQLIEQARRDWEANRGVANKLLALVDLMVRMESEENENEAIGLLEEEYASARNYAFKQKADELRMRQLKRRRRTLASSAQAAPDDAEARELLHAHDRKQVETETRIYEERRLQYPTDLRLKFELAVRYFRSGRNDDAIPLFQQSRADPRIRVASLLYAGRCFYNKRFHTQAVETLRRGLAEIETDTHQHVLELNYWLARALEASKEAGEAKKVYGYLIQLDYNFRDARRRLEQLVAEEES